MGSFGSTADLSETASWQEDKSLPGMRLYGGLYAITRPVKRSGLGRVYGARDFLGRDIFLTVCSEGPFWNEDQSAKPQDMPEQEDGPTRQIGFVLQEANCLSDMDHPNIVAFHQAFASGKDSALTSEPVIGHTLREVIDNPDRCLGPEQIITIACVMLDALRSIHALGLLHGDVSVDTILLNAESEPFLVDFGAVRCTNGVRQDTPDEEDNVSAVEGCLSDVAYEPGRDLRGLAAALHHAVTGKPIAQADTLTTAAAVIGPVPKLADSVVGYPRGFLESIDIALETPPAACFQSSEEWLDVLRGLLRRKDPKMKLLEKALGLGRPKSIARSKDQGAEVADDKVHSPGADVDPTIGVKDHSDVAADRPEAVSNDVSPLLPPLQLVQEGPPMAVDLSGLKDITGFIAGCLVDCDSGLMLASELVGKFDIETAAAANVDVVRGKQNAVRLLGLNDSIEDILITLSSQFHLIRPLEGAPNLFLYAALDRKVANLGMARLQVKKVEQSIQF